MPECRICFESTNTENNPLIVPCNCNGSSRYIHRICLETWREANVNNDAYITCRECLYKYNIEFTHSPEEFICRSQTLFHFSRYGVWMSINAWIFLMGLFIRTIDKFIPYGSIEILPTNYTNKKTLKKMLEEDSLLEILYYYAWLVFCFTIISYILLAIYITNKQKRKLFIWKKFILKYFIYFFGSLHFIYLFLLFQAGSPYTENIIFETYVNGEIILSSTNYMIFINLLSHYNALITRMNRINLGYVENREEPTLVILNNEDNQEEDEEDETDEATIYQCLESIDIN